MGANWLQYKDDIVLCQLNNPSIHPTYSKTALHHYQETNEPFLGVTMMHACFLWSFSVMNKITNGQDSSRNITLFSIPCIIAIQLKYLWKWVFHFGGVCLQYVQYIPNNMSICISQITGKLCVTRHLCRSGLTRQLNRRLASPSGSEVMEID